VRGDKFRLRQALINVTNNSIKYTREGGEVCIQVSSWAEKSGVARQRGDVEISQGVGSGRVGSWAVGHPEHHDGAAGECDARLGDRGELLAAPCGMMGAGEAATSTRRVYVQFCVIDTGIGIAEDKMDIIFMPFGQASISSTREYGGTGLGLAITTNIMRSLGGTVGCVSELGRGTTMTLELPLDIPRAGVSGSRSFTRKLPAPDCRLSHTSLVVTLVAKESLGAAIGRAANSKGAAHECAHGSGRFPHTEHERQLWGAGVVETLYQTLRTSRGGVVVVMEEQYLEPVWAQWHTRFGGNPETSRDAFGYPSSPGFVAFPPVVLLVGKKMKVVRGGVGTFVRLSAVERNSYDTSDTVVGGGGGSVWGASQFAGLSAEIRPGVVSHLAQGRDAGRFRASQNDTALTRREEGWQVLLRSVFQVIRPVKPTCLKEALQRADRTLGAQAAAAAHEASAFFGADPESGGLGRLGISSPKP